MSARGRTTSFISLEVWLGPMEGLRYLGDPAASGNVIRMGRVPGDKARGENQFVLSRGVGISGAHAELRYDRGRMYLKDLGSTNGTFAAQKRLSSEAEIASGDIFLLSFTPVFVELLDEPGTATLQAVDAVTADSWTDPILSSILDGARKAAEQRGEAYIDSRHLCDAVLRSRNAFVQRALRDADWSREEALTELWEGGLFKSPSLSWLAEVLNRPVEMKTGAADYLVSPKVARLLEGALRRITGGTSEETETNLRVDVLGSLLQDAHGAVGSWLLKHGLNVPAPPPPPPSEARFERAATPGSRSQLPRPAETARERGEARRFSDPAMKTEVSSFPGSPGRVTEREPAPSPPPPPAPPPPTLAFAPPAATPVKAPAPVPPLRAATRPDLEAVRLPEERPGDGLLEQQARELARDLLETATSYRFSTAADRREALKSRILRELLGVSPEKRRAAVDQIRAQFPVAARPADSDDEVPRLRKQLRALERQLEAAKAGPAKERELPWQELLARGGEHPKSADPRAEALREIVDFAANMERFLLGLVQSITMPGSSTENFKLPTSRDNMDGYLAALRDGKAGTVEGLVRYLGQLQRWQVAIFAAHHEAPKLWFHKLWKRINPAAIEAAPRPAGWKLRGETADWWDMYKKTVSGLTPDVVQDQVLQFASQFARDEFEKLRKRKVKDE